MNAVTDLTIVVLGLAFSIATVVAYKKHCDVADLREEIKDADAKIAALLRYIDSLRSTSKQSNKKGK